jgi:hypothetical protein
MNVAFGWYTQAWARLYEVVADPDTLAGSHEEFLDYLHQINCRGDAVPSTAGVVDRLN